MPDNESFDLLFRHLFAQGKQETKADADRELSGTYINGYKNVVTTSTLEKDGLTIVATKVAWSTMTPGSDKDGTRFVFEVKRGEETLYKASREGASKSVNFGAEERYEGTDQVPAQDWKDVEGALPKELQLAPTA